MNQIPNELIIGAAGSILGALVVYVGQSGLSITKVTRQRSRAKSLGKSLFKWEISVNN